MITLHNNQVSLIPEIYAATHNADEKINSALAFLAQAEARFGETPSKILDTSPSV